MRVSIIAFICTFAFQINSFSQWEQTNGPDDFGGNVSSITKLGSSYFAIIPSYGLYKSSNNGTNWINISTVFNKTQVNCLISDNTNIYIGTSNGMYYSTNQGLSWIRALNNGLNYTDFFSLTYKQNKLFAGTAGGVYISTNFGNSWIRTLGLSSNPVYGISADSLDGTNTYVYAYTSSNLYLSTDDGASWNYLNFSGYINCISASGPYVFIATSGGMYISGDFGYNFHQGGPSFPLFCVATHGDTVYTGGLNWIARSYKNDSNWVNIPTNFESNSIFFSGNTVAVGTLYLGVLLSSDSGNSWNNASNGLILLPISSMGNINNNIFVSTLGDGIFGTSNNGDSWFHLSDNISEHYVWQISISGSYIYAVESSSIYYSSNSGLNWITIGNGGEKIASYGNDLYSAQDVGGFNNPVLTKHSEEDKLHGINLTTNFGVSWNWKYPTSDVYALSVNSNAVVASVDAGLIISFDNGNTWQNIGSGLPSPSTLTCLYLNNNNIYAGFLGNGLYLSTNFGNKWIQINSNPLDSNINCLSFDDPYIFAGTYNGVFLSSNMGSNWIGINDGLPSKVTIEGLSINQDGTFLFAGTAHYKVWKLSIQSLTGVKPVSNQIPKSYILSQNYPNPFNPSTKINYELPKNGFVKLVVYDVLGNEVKTLVNEKQNAGSYNVEFDGSNFPSGVYFDKLTAGDYSATKKLVLIK